MMIGVAVINHLGNTTHGLPGITWRARMRRAANKGTVVSFASLRSVPAPDQRVRDRAPHRPDD